MIRDYNWSRVSHYDGAEPFPEPFFGISGFRVQIIHGPGYHIHDGDTPLTRERILDDPMAKEGTWDLPPIDLLNMLGMHECTLEVNHNGRYGNASGSHKVQRNGSWSLIDGELTEPKPEELTEACKYWRPDSTAGDDPLHKFPYPGYFLDMNQPARTDVIQAGGAQIPYSRMGSFAVENISGEFESGADITVETGLPIGGDSEESYVIRLATFYPKGPQEHASASIRISASVVYFAMHEIWLLPVSASASSQDAAPSIALTNQDLYLAMTTPPSPPENKEIIDALIEDEFSKFYEENPAIYEVPRSFGPGAYTATPAPLVESPYTEITYDTNFVSGTFSNRELSEIFLPFELAS